MDSDGSCLMRKRKPLFFLQSSWHGAAGLGSNRLRKPTLHVRRGLKTCELFRRRLSIVSCEENVADDESEPSSGRRLPALPDNLPNKLTVFRVAMVPAIILIMILPYFHLQRTLSTLLFGLAALTDYLDGLIARITNQYTPFGAFLDPVADKLMVCTVLILLASQIGDLIGLPAALIVGREIFVSALREFMASRGRRDSVAVGVWGKFKTAMQMLALLILLAYGPGSSLFKLGILLLYISTLLTISSAVVYIRAALPELSSTKA